MIPESQLDTWSHQGAITTAKATHESIRNALNPLEVYLQGSYRNAVNPLEVYLQGSYKNNTNIHGDSDVDVVVQLNSSFQYDPSKLSEPENVIFKQRYSNATYLWENFRGDALKALQAYYGASVISEGNKSIKIVGGSGRLPADVVVCIQYRKDKHFSNINSEQFFEGIAFYTHPENRNIISFPKLHYDNGVRKMSYTKGGYKSIVRLFKNARTYLFDHNVIAKDLAPSYFLECLIYNVPNDKFKNNYQNTFCNVVNWLAKVNFNNFVCQNEQTSLFGNSTEQWSIENAKLLTQKFIELWNNWNN